MCVDFVLLTRGTPVDIFSNEGGEAGPPKLGGNQLASFQITRVTGRFMIMAAG